MAKITSYLANVELDGESDSVTVHRLPLDENGEVIEDADTYDWEIEVFADGTVTVYPNEGEVFAFDPFAAQTRAFLTAQYKEA